MGARRARALVPALEEEHVPARRDVVQREPDGADEAPALLVTQTGEVVD